MPAMRGGQPRVRPVASDDRGEISKGDDAAETNFDDLSL
jgi:hypothetical protein